MQSPLYYSGTTGIQLARAIDKLGYGAAVNEETARAVSLQILGRDTALPSPCHSGAAGIDIARAIEKLG